MHLFNLLMAYAQAMDETDLRDLREAQKACDAEWSKGGHTQAEMAAMCRVRGILHEEIQLFTDPE